MRSTPPGGSFFPRPTEDIIYLLFVLSRQALRASVLRVEQYVRSVEDKLADGSVVVKKK